MYLIVVGRLHTDCYMHGPYRPFRYCFWSREPFDRPPAGSSLAVVMPR